MYLVIFNALKTLISLNIHQKSRIKLIVKSIWILWIKIQVSNLLKIYVQTQIIVKKEK